MIVAASLTGIAIAYAAALGLLLDSVRGFYRIETWRQDFLNQRLVGYVGYFFALAIASWVFTFILNYSATLNRAIRPPEWSRSWKRLGSILLLCICILLGIRFSLGLWRGYQSPCWDGYCTYATLIRSWLTEPSDRTRDNLINWMHRDYHSNSPIGPAIMAILSIVTGRSVEYSYALMSGIATLGILACAWWWLNREANSLSWIRFPAFLLLLTNPAVVRCFIFLQTDALVSFWIVAVISLGIIRFKPSVLATTGRGHPLVYGSVRKTLVLASADFLAGDRRSSSISTAH